MFWLIEIDWFGNQLLYMYVNILSWSYYTNHTFRSIQMRNIFKNQGIRVNWWAYQSEHFYSIQFCGELRQISKYTLDSFFLPVYFA